MQGRQRALLDIGQHQILMVADPDLTETEGLGGIGHRAHLI